MFPSIFASAPSAPHVDSKYHSQCNNSPKHEIRKLKSVAAQNCAPRSLRSGTGGATLVSIIEVPGRLLIFGFSSRPWCLIVNLVADPRLRRFDSRWPQTLMRCAACAALSDRRCALRCGRTLQKEIHCSLFELLKTNYITQISELFSVH